MIYEKLAEIIAEKIDCDPSEIQPQTRFEDLGIDSLDITEIVMSVEDAFGIEIDVSADLACVSDLAAKIEELTAQK